MLQRNRLVVITGGGTGGHIVPALAICDAFKDKGYRVLFIGSNGGLERKLVVPSGYPFVLLPVKGWLGKSLGQRIVAFLSLVYSIFCVLLLFVRDKPWAVVGTGGYTSFPVILVGMVLGCRTVLLEENKVAGLTTKFLAPFVSAVALAFHNTVGIRARRVVVTGLPLRNPRLVPKEQACKHFGFDSRVPVLFVFGGSQGARRLNRTIVKLVPEMEGWQFLIQTGDKDFEWVNESLKGRAGVVVKEFIHEMHYAYASASVVVCRAGAMTVAELRNAAKPAVLIPFPYATHNHQYFNALEMVKEGRGILIEDEELDVETLLSAINRAVELNPSPVNGGDAKWKIVELVEELCLAR